MKDYVEPIVEITVFTEDVVTASGVEPLNITPNDGDTMVRNLW